MQGPRVDIMISLIISQTSMVNSLGLKTLGVLLGMGLVGCLHLSLSSYHFTQCSIFFNIIIQPITQVKYSMDDQVEVQMGDYVFTQKYCIGQGSFGKVYKGKNILNGKEVAIKQMDSQLITEQEISREITILKQLKHPNIVEYQDAFQNNGFFYIVTEYCGGGDLRNLLDSDEEDQEEKEKKILNMLWQVCQGFKYLRKFDIIHRDLKPSNILIHRGLYKIADFGLAKRQNVHKSVYNQELMGVPIYMSPQNLSKNYYTYKCDVWSIGIIVFQMLYEHLPWKSQDVESLFFQIMNNPKPYSQIKEPRSEIFDVIFEKTLSYLEKERASWDQLLELRDTKDFSRKQKLSKSRKVIQKIQLFLNKINKNISSDQAEILNHVYSQGKSLQNEIINITNEECLHSLFATIEKYMIQGPELRGMLRDCSFIFLKIAQSNLYLQLMEYEQLQESRSLLIFLELLHDYVRNIDFCPQFSKKYFNGSLRSKEIAVFAASVISKLNTLMQSQQNDIV